MPLPTPSRRDAVAAAAGLVAATLAGCSGAAPARSDPTTPPAEPADAPSPTTSPAGSVREVGYAAEGLVHDPLTGLLAVGVRRPERLLVLDPDSLEVVRTVVVPGTVRHLGVVPGAGTVLVPNEAADALVEVDLATGATRSTRVGHVPHDAAATADGEVLVADEFGGSLSVLRGGRVVHTFEDLRQPGGVAAVGRHAVVVDVAEFTVSTYDLDRMERVGREPAGRGPTHVVALGLDRAAVADTRGGRLLLVEVSPLRQVGEVDLGRSPYGLAAGPGGGTVWTSLTAANQVVAVDSKGGRPRVVERYPTVRQPNSVAVDTSGGVLWVASRTDGTVQRIVR